MGTKKFKLSDMIPNAWFYKLKDMNKSSSKTFKTHHHLQPPPPPPPPPSSPPLCTVKTPSRPDPQCPSRKSYHVSRDLTIDLPNELDPPRKSKSSTKSRKSHRRSCSISSCSCQSSSSNYRSYRSKSRSPPSPPSLEETSMKNVGIFPKDALLKLKHQQANKQSIFRNALTDVKKHQREHFDEPPSLKETDIENVGFSPEDTLLKLKPGCASKPSILKNALADDNQNQPEHFDIDIDVDKMSLQTSNNINNNNFDIQLPPIITKQKPKPKPNVGKMTINSPGGVRLKMNSPRIIGRKQGQNGHKNVGRKSTSSKKRRSISESYAVVKSSYDPQRDFKESMVEMILENNLTAAKDLEDLLACYLSLNSDEYHEVIIKVFKQIWIDLRNFK
ncbi:hypothetical protein RND81_05G017400 [Saponaria officinalis]|uniref:Transcription repressor n=1 Tax=Saponaria officinalis TaxID=3572 RepID=A0AAW1KTX0_SAPOF